MRRARRALSAVGLVAVVAWTSLSATSAQAASPAWQVTSISAPTNFAPGDAPLSANDAYRILLTNVGDATQGAASLTIADTLPAGLKATSIEAFPGLGRDLAPSDCTLAPLRCVLPGGTLEPERTLDLLVHVAVPLGAEGPLTNSVTVSGGGAPEATALSTNEVTATTAPFGIEAFPASLREPDGSPPTQAGGHPYEFSAEVNFNTVQSGYGGGSGSHGDFFTPSGDPRDLTVDLPPGLIGNPQAIPQCSLAEYQAEACPEDTQVGTWSIGILGSTRPAAGVIYNLTPQPGVAAELGFRFSFVGNFIVFAGLRSGADYGIRTTSFGILEARVPFLQFTIWGVPAAAGHDHYRADCLSRAQGSFEGTCPSPYPDERPFLTNPTSCPAAPPLLGASADSWQQPGVFAHAATALGEQPLSGCNQLQFEPTIEARPTTNLADSPSGLDVDLHIPKGGLEEPENPTEANLRGAVVTLPRGISVNPASANGQGACTEAQVGYQPGTSAPFEFTPDPAACPDAAKLGTVEVDSPLVKAPLPGAVYLAKPFENPFGSLLAIYIAIDDPVSGTIVKLAGKVTPDPQTGQLTTTFEENPQVPFEDFHLHFFKGALGPLRTPATCGGYETTSVLTPWSAPESGPPATPKDEFAIVSGANGGACPHNAPEQPNAPVFRAGTESPQAGAFTPFAVKVIREDGSQEIKGVEVTLPPGLTGKLAGVGECTEAQLAQATSREHDGGGAEEQADPSCPASSKLGTVEVGAGAGPTPLYISGPAYLAGPYKGAPLSLAIVIPAVAGPFDLGAVVVRDPLYVDPETARIRAVDNHPHILDGIPLDIRSITVKVNRPDFTLNPTNCEELGFTGAATSVFDQSAPLSQRFQVGGCNTLRFKPKLSLSLKGRTTRAGTPALKAVLKMPAGNANIARAQVTLPPTEGIDNAHFRNVCTRVQFAASQCPADSVIGHARAETPLLEAPLEGPVYLMTGFGHELPDIFADLNGQIRVELHGRVDTGKGGGLRSTFEVVPDAPVSKFTLAMDGGKKGLLENSTNLCARPHRATAEFKGQNGAVSLTEPLLQVKCPKHGRKGKKHAKHHHRPSRAG
jgi:hypothetical protein